MTILTILEFPDPKLRTKARPVERFDTRLQQLVNDMLETMYAANGIGLAATQVDIHEQVIVMDISEQRNQPLIFINPQVNVLGDDLAAYDEGCLSVPGFYESIDRPTQVIVNAFDVEGNAFEMQPDGLTAICIQHEIDHLAGKLFVDYLSPIKRSRIRKKLEKLHKQ